MNIRDTVISEVRKHLGNNSNKSGAVLYNGWGTLCASNEGLCIMGFNPGGDPDKIETSVVKSLEDIKENHCSYEDECWKCPKDWDCQNKEHFGIKPHQKRVKLLAKILGYDIRKVLAVNAIFIRSTNSKNLQGHTESTKLFEECWPVHRLFLSIVKPKVILCLGNGEVMSSFALLREKLALKPDQIRSHGQVKVFSSAIAVSGGETINSHVIGVRHPSQPWFNPTEDLRLYLQKNPDVMSGQRWSEA